MQVLKGDQGPLFLVANLITDFGEKDDYPQTCIQTDTAQIVW